VIPDGILTNFLPRVHSAGTIQVPSPRTTTLEHIVVRYAVKSFRFFLAGYWAMNIGCAAEAQEIFEVFALEPVPVSSSIFSEEREIEILSKDTDPAINCDQNPRYARWTLGSLMSSDARPKRTTPSST
jgi:hypothetical protein